MGYKHILQLALLASNGLLVISQPTNPPTFEVTDGATITDEESWSITDPVLEIEETILFLTQTVGGHGDDCDDLGCTIKDITAEVF